MPSLEVFSVLLIVANRACVTCKQNKPQVLWTEEAAMRKSILALRRAGYQSIIDLPRIQKSHREQALNGDSNDNEDVCNVERQAKSSGINSDDATTVTQTATAYATVL